MNWLTKDFTIIFAIDYIHIQNTFNNNGFFNYTKIIFSYYQTSFTDLGIQVEMYQ